MNLDPFHLCCPVTHNGICRCKFLHTDEGLKSFTESAKMVYQMYTYRNKEFEKEFGKAHILHKVKLSEDQKKYLPSFKPQVHIKAPQPITKQKNSFQFLSKKYEIKIPSAPILTFTPKEKEKPVEVQKAPVTPLPPPLGPDGTPIKRGRGRPRTRPPDCKKCKGENQENLLGCVGCRKIFIHTSCHEPNLDHVPEKYRTNWRCENCKVCEKCSSIGEEAKIVICDKCDRGFHTYCMNMSEIPKGSWSCGTCDK